MEKKLAYGSKRPATGSAKIKGSVSKGKKGKNIVTKGKDLRAGKK